MSDNRLTEFRQFREKMNKRIFELDNLNINRFFTLDGKAYENAALPTLTKEFAGLSASLVLRCDDCIAYHIDQCVKAGLTDEELWECFDVALIVGGSIIIPHLRRAVEFLDQARDHARAHPAGCACGGH